MKPNARTPPAVLREVEHKFGVAALFELPDLTLAGRLNDETLPPVTQTAVYYDSVDLRLFRWGITLRRREGGDDAGWHLKLPVEVTGGSRHVRDELQLPLADHPGLKVPIELTDLLPGFLRGAGLLPVVTLRTVRHAHLLRDQSGDLIAELVDDTVSVVNGRSLVARFREIEVEERAPASELAAVLAELRAAGAIPSSISKAAAALGPAAAAPADIPRPGPVGPGDPASAAIEAYLRGQARALLFADLNVRRDMPDSVHQLRVSVRRLRSALRTFRPLLAPDFGADLRTELGWLANELGDSRDTEVLLLRLDEHAGVLPAEDAAAVRRVAAKILPVRLATARERALAALESDRALALLGLLVERVTAVEFGPGAENAAEQELPTLVDAAWLRLRRAARRLEFEGISEEWHRVRILAKRARYAVEAVSGVFGAPAVERAAALAEVTECLGEHQDAWLAQSTLRELSRITEVTAAEAFGLGVLHEYERECEYGAREQFGIRWQAVKRLHRNRPLGATWRE